jgi:hypothetical protein
MPNYSGFEPQRPFGSFIAGMGAADTMRHTALKNEAIEASLEQQKRQRAALQTYKDTGDSRELIPYMTPEQAMTAPSADELQKLKIGAAAVDWWDKVKGNATLETYPAIMADAAQRFPSIAQMHLPPAESFRSPADFEKWKYEKEAIAARFKQMASPYLGRPVTLRPGGVAIDPITGKKLYEQPAEPKVYKPEAFTGPNNEVRWVEPGKPVPSGFTKVGTAKTVWGNMADAAKVGNWDEFDFYKSLWDQQHPGTRPQLFKSTTGNTYKWVTPIAGQELPAGYRPVSEDAFKALLGSVAGNTIPAPIDNAVQQKATVPSTGGPSLQERAAAELARRNAGQQ